MDIGRSVQSPLMDKSVSAGGGLPVVRIWFWPALLATLSVFGLLSALLGQGGIWWVLSWIALATPLAVIMRCLWGTRRV